ncbi:hypothetical protein HDU85_004502 [Gaertneriomyces sp. JEL0708]|nr:hypothetical protein HDU85_004502 [Gaertneriomyces sp. JEL0708]
MDQPTAAVGERRCEILRHEVERLRAELTAERELFEEYSKYVRGALPNRRLSIPIKTDPTDPRTENINLRRTITLLEKRLRAVRADVPVWKEKWNDLKVAAEEEVLNAISEVESICSGRANGADEDYATFFDVVQRAERTVKYAFEDLDCQYAKLLEEHIVMQNESEQTNENLIQLQNVNHELQRLVDTLSAYASSENKPRMYSRDSATAASQTSLAVSPTAHMLKSYIPNSRRASMEFSAETLAEYPPFMPGKGKHVRAAELDTSAQTLGGTGLYENESPYPSSLSLADAAQAAETNRHTPKKERRKSLLEKVAPPLQRQSRKVRHYFRQRWNVGGL